MWSITTPGGVVYELSDEQVMIPVKKYGELVAVNNLSFEVKEGEIIATLYTNNQAKIEPAMKIIYDSYRIDDVKPEERPLILSKII